MRTHVRRGTGTASLSLPRFAEPFIFMSILGNATMNDACPHCGNEMGIDIYAGVNGLALPVYTCRTHGRFVLEQHWHLVPPKPEALTSCQDVATNATRD